MKQAITIIFLFLSLSAFSQKDSAIKKIDSVKINFSLADLQLVYRAVDNSHEDHQQVKRLLGIIQEEYLKQTKK